MLIDGNPGQIAAPAGIGFRTRHPALFACRRHVAAIFPNDQQIAMSPILRGVEMCVAEKMGVPALKNPFLSPQNSSCITRIESGGVNDAEPPIMCGG